MDGLVLGDWVGRMAMVPIPISPLLIIILPKEIGKIVTCKKANWNSQKDMIIRWTWRKLILSKTRILNFSKNILQSIL
jgi:hypothetical protein